MLTLLTELTDELERRKKLFRDTGCANIGDYNKQSAVPLQRHIFACDEVAEVLDKTGLTKEQKENIIITQRNKCDRVLRTQKNFSVLKNIIGEFLCVIFVSKKSEGSFSK